MKKFKKYEGIVLLGLGFLYSFFVQTMDEKIQTSLTHQDFQATLKYVVKDLGYGMQQHRLFTDNDSLVCSLTTVQDPALTIMCDNGLSIDISKLPSIISYVITAIWPTLLLVGPAIKKKYSLNSLNNVAMIINLYVFPDYRGKGCAHRLLEETSADLFSKGIDIIALSPAPFEFESGVPKELKDTEKKQRLVKLYQQCEFKNNDENNPLFMFKDKNKN